MLVITIDLHSARTHQVTRLAQAQIANDGQGTPTRGNYRAHFEGKRGRFIESAIVNGFPRKRLLAWDLLYRALRAAFGDRNGDVTASTLAGQCLDHQATIRTLRETNARLESAVRWALGEIGTFPPPPPILKGTYYWRSELRRKAGL
jgi:hypothetical protein